MDVGEGRIAAASTSRSGMYSEGYGSRRQLKSSSVSALDSSGWKLKSGICIPGETPSAPKGEIGANYLRRLSINLLLKRVRDRPLKQNS